MQSAGCSIVECSQASRRALAGRRGDLDVPVGGAPAAARPQRARHRTSRSARARREVLEDVGQVEAVELASPGRSRGPPRARASAPRRRSRWARIGAKFSARRRAGACRRGGRERSRQIRVGGGSRAVSAVADPPADRCADVAFDVRGRSSGRARGGHDAARRRRRNSSAPAPGVPVRVVETARARPGARLSRSEPVAAARVDERQDALAGRGRDSARTCRRPRRRRDVARARVPEGARRRRERGAAAGGRAPRAARSGASRRARAARPCSSDAERRDA